MKNVGGYIRGPWWRNRGEEADGTRRCFVIAWGDVVRSPDEKYKDRRMVRFAVKTGRGADKSEKYLVCVAYGEQTADVIVRAIERGDVVLVCGTWVEKPYENKKGKRIMRYECQVHYVIPQGLIGFLLDLYSTPQIAEQVKNRLEEEPDAWEGD